MRSGSPAPARVRRWIRDKLCGHDDPGTVVAMLCAAGWPQPVALAALAQALDERDAADAHVEPARPVPDVVGGRAPAAAASGPRIVAKLDRPHIVLLSHFLADDECDALIRIARAGLAQSETIDPRDGGSYLVSPIRTSSGAALPSGANPVVACIERRIGRLFGWPAEACEPLQAMHYAPGQEYRVHYDFFPSETDVVRDAGRPSLQHQRVASLVMYLNTPASGGETVFPELALTIPARKGHALFFSYDRPHAASRTLHAGAPVIAGEKWIATCWFQDRPVPGSSPMPGASAAPETSA